MWSFGRAADPLALSNLFCPIISLTWNKVFAHSNGCNITLTSELFVSLTHHYTRSTKQQWLTLTLAHARPRANTRELKHSIVVLVQVVKRFVQGHTVCVSANARAGRVNSLVQQEGNLVQQDFGFKSKESSVLGCFSLVITRKHNPRS